MHRYALTLAALLIAAPLLAQTTPEPPLNTPAGIVILGPELSPPSPVPGTNPIYCTAGRFIPITPADGMPSYIADSPGYRVYRVAPGSSYTGVKFDAADNAEPEVYSWPTAKGPVYCLLARNVPGRYAVQLVKNGSVETGPVANGAPIMVEVGQGPRPPPPGPTPVPPTPTPPAPTDPFWATFAATYASDPTPGKADLARKMASVYRVASTTTYKDAGLKTAGDLYKTVSEAADSLAPLPNLRSVRLAVAIELQSKLGTDLTVPLTDALRETARQQFARFAQLYDAIGGQP